MAQLAANRARKLRPKDTAGAPDVKPGRSVQVP